MLFVIVIASATAVTVGAADMNLLHILRLLASLLPRLHYNQNACILFTVCSLVGDENPSDVAAIAE